MFDLSKKNKEYHYWLNRCDESYQMESNIPTFA